MFFLIQTVFRKEWSCLFVFICKTIRPRDIKFLLLFYRQHQKDYQLSEQEILQDIVAYNLSLCGVASNTSPSYCSRLIGNHNPPCLSVCIVCPSVWPPVCVSFCLTVSDCPFICLCFCLFDLPCLSICPSGFKTHSPVNLLTTQVNRRIQRKQLIVFFFIFLNEQYFHSCYK